MNPASALFFIHPGYEYEEMLTPEIILALGLQEQPEMACAGGTRRIFRWPELAGYEAMIRECSLKGNRLPKNNQIILTYSAQGKPKRLVLTNEQLTDHVDHLKEMVITSNHH